MSRIHSEENWYKGIPYPWTIQRIDIKGEAVAAWAWKGYNTMTGEKTDLWNTYEDVIQAINNKQYHENRSTKS